MITLTPMEFIVSLMLAALVSAIIYQSMILKIVRRFPSNMYIDDIHSSMNRAFIFTITITAGLTGWLIIMLNV